MSAFRVLFLLCHRRHSHFAIFTMQGVLMSSKSVTLFAFYSHIHTRVLSQPRTRLFPLFPFSLFTLRYLCFKPIPEINNSIKAYWCTEYERGDSTKENAYEKDDNTLVEHESNIKM